MKHGKKKLAILILLIVSFTLSPFSSFAQAASGYKVIASGKKGPTNGYTYYYEVAIDKTGHSISACPDFNGKTHLNIKVWEQKGKGSKKLINDLHILAKKGCLVVIHDARGGMMCKKFDYCFQIKNIGRMLASAGVVYAVKDAIANVISEYWYLILPLFTL